MLYDHPLQIDLHQRLAESAQQGKPPLDIHTYPRDVHWQRLLHSLIAELKPEMSGRRWRCWRIWRRPRPPSWKPLPARCWKANSPVSSDKAPFIWAALSIYWAQMAAMIPGKARAEYGEHRQFCPVCASVPVASVVHMDVGQQGLRYLHCNLCESEWYVVRSKCSNCEQTRDLHYWSLDSEQAAVKAESCGDCGTYLKMLYRERSGAGTGGRRSRLAGAGCPHGAGRIRAQQPESVYVSRD